MTDDQRALLDECTHRPTCAARLHLSGCPAPGTAALLRGGSPTERDRIATQCRAWAIERFDQHGPADGQGVALWNVAAWLSTSSPATAPPERQVWERRIPGTDVPLTRIHLTIGPDGRALVHEAVLAQLLTDAGWERAQ